MMASRSGCAVIIWTSIGRSRRRTSGHWRIARMRIGLAVARLLPGLAAAGCETDSDWVAANPGRFDYLSAGRQYMPECAGQNGAQWRRLETAPPKAEEYLRHAQAAVQPHETGRA